MSKDPKETTSDSEKEITIEFAPGVTDDLEAIYAEDPESRDVFRELFANMRQAMQSVKDGRYKNFGDAMEAITGKRPTRVGIDDA